MNKRSCVWLVLLFSVSVLVFAGCQKSGDDDDNGGDVSFHSVSFTPEGQGGAGDLWLELGDVDVAHGKITLKVIGDAFAAYGVAGRLLFDQKVLMLTGAYAGDALAGENVQIVAAGAANDEGGVFGFSRSGDYSSSAEVTKSKVIGTLEFKLIAHGTAEITFNADRSRVVNEVLDSVEVAHWLGGTVMVE